MIRRTEFAAIGGHKVVSNGSSKSNPAFKVFSSAISEHNLSSVWIVPLIIPDECVSQKTETRACSFVKMS